MKRSKNIKKVIIALLLVVIMALGMLPTMLTASADPTGLDGTTLAGGAFTRQITAPGKTIGSVMVSDNSNRPKVYVEFNAASFTAGKGSYDIKSITIGLLTSETALDWIAWSGNSTNVFDSDAIKEIVGDGYWYSASVSGDVLSLPATMTILPGTMTIDGDPVSYFNVDFSGENGIIDCLVFVEFETSLDLYMTGNSLEGGENPVKVHKDTYDRSTLQPVSIAHPGGLWNDTHYVDNRCGWQSSNYIHWIEYTCNNNTATPIVSSTCKCTNPTAPNHSIKNCTCGPWHSILSSPATGNNPLNWNNYLNFYEFMRDELLAKGIEFENISPWAWKNIEGYSNENDARVYANGRSWVPLIKETTTVEGKVTETGNYIPESKAEWRSTFGDVAFFEMEIKGAAEDKTIESLTYKVVADNAYTVRIVERDADGEVVNSVFLGADGFIGTGPDDEIGIGIKTITANPPTIPTATTEVILGKTGLSGIQMYAFLRTGTIKAQKDAEEYMAENFDKLWSYAELPGIFFNNDNTLKTQTDFWNDIPPADIEVTLPDSANNQTAIYAFVGYCLETFQTNYNSNEANEELRSDDVIPSESSHTIYELFGNFPPSTMPAGVVTMPGGVDGEIQGGNIARYGTLFGPGVVDSSLWRSMMAQDVVIYGSEQDGETYPDGALFLDKIFSPENAWYVEIAIINETMAASSYDLRGNGGPLGNIGGGMFYVEVTTKVRELEGVYKPNLAEYTIKKVIEIENGPPDEDHNSQTFNFSLTKGNEVTRTPSITLSEDEWEGEINVILPVDPVNPNTYWTITESTTDEIAGDLIGIGGYYTYRHTDIKVWDEPLKGGEGDWRSTSQLTVPPEDGEVTVTNVYRQPEKAYIKGTKTISGNYTGADKEFTFNAVQVDGVGADSLTSPAVPLSGSPFSNAISIGKADTDGKEFTITVSGLTIPTEATMAVYWFKVTEDQTGNGVNGWTYDEHEFWAKVTVTANTTDGTASTSVDYYDATSIIEDDEPEFVNTYDTDPESVALEATKVAEGRVLDQEFSFGVFEEVYDEDLDDYIDVEIATATNATSTTGYRDDITFAPELTYTLEDLEGEGYKVFTYTMKETSVSADFDGWTVDPTQVTVTVTVTDNGDGTLDVDVQYDGETNPPEFVNTYDTDGTSINLAATKSVDGALDEWSFNFRLYDSDKDGTQGELREEKTAEKTTTTDNSTVTFEAIPYTVVGIHYYLIEEVNDSLAGWIYDDTKYLVKVDVTDNGSGQLIKTVTYTTITDDEPGEYDDYDYDTGVEFTNIYSTVSIAVRKVWDDDIDTNNTRPEDGITFNLKQNGEIIATHKIEAPWDEDEFTFVFDKDGNVLAGYNTYTVEEEAVDGYITTVIEPGDVIEEVDDGEDIIATGYIFTNTRRPEEEVVITITKILDIPEDYSSNDLPDAVLICGFEDVHEHDEDCYEHDDKTLVCTHEHDDDCYTWDWEPRYETLIIDKLICEEDECEHESDECWELGIEVEGEEIIDYVLVPTLDCPHVHDDEDCYEETDILVCDIPVHTHTSACYSCEDIIDYDVSNETFTFKFEVSGTGDDEIDGIYEITFGGEGNKPVADKEVDSIFVTIPGRVFQANDETVITIEEVDIPAGWSVNEENPQTITINRFGDIRYFDRVLWSDDESDDEPEEELVEAIEAVFINTYGASEIPAIKIIKQTTNARTGKPENAVDKIPEGGFSFTIAKDGNDLGTVTIPANRFTGGMASITVYLPKLRDQSLRGVTVTENKAGFGEIWDIVGSETQRLIRDDEMRRTVTFENEFKDDRYPTINVRKVTNIPTDETFEIQISGSGFEGTFTISSGNNFIPLDSLMNYSGTLTLREVGSKPYWNYDKTVYEITIEKGVIVGSSVFTFFNSYYEETPVINISKTVVRAPRNRNVTFYFDLFKLDEDGEIIDEDNPITIPITTQGNGTYSGFMTLSEYTNKTAKLLLRERTGNAAGWTYDKTVYTVTIVNGIITLDWVNGNTEGTVEGNTASFTNSYTPGGGGGGDDDPPGGDPDPTTTVTTTEEITTTEVITTIENITTTEPTIEETTEEIIEDVTEAPPPLVDATFPDEPEETTEEETTEATTEEPTTEEEIFEELEEPEPPKTVIDITEKEELPDPIDDGGKPNPKTGDGIIPILLMISLMGAGAITFAYARKRLSRVK